MNIPLSPITIRPARAGDGPAYRELRLEALRLHPSAFSADLERAEAMSPEEWEKRLGDGREVVLFFAVDGSGALLGMAGARLGWSSKTRHSADLFSVYLHHAWRGRGIGQALVQACIDWARAQGAAHIKLGVEAGNLAAIRCYTRLGFQDYGREHQALRVDDVDYDFLLMQRRLD